MFYKKRLINTLNCKYKLFINRCVRKFEKVFLALTPLKLQSNENLFLNLLNFNNVFSCHNKFFFIISCMYLNYSYFCRLKKSVPYVVPVKGYLLDTVDFLTFILFPFNFMSQLHHREIQLKLRFGFGGFQIVADDV